MGKQELLGLMLDLLRKNIDEDDLEEGVTIVPTTPLIGHAALVTSLTLVSFIADVEARIEELYGVELVLVSEDALSRRHSPFLSLERLCDYVFDLLIASRHHHAAGGV